MSNINYKKEIWEGWTIQDFIDELEPTFDLIMAGNSWQEPFKNKEEVKAWCINNQPHISTYIPEVVEYFTSKL